MVFDIIGASQKGPNEKYGDRYPIDYPFDINKVYMTSKIHITYPLRILIMTKIKSSHHVITALT